MSGRREERGVGVVLVMGMVTVLATVSLIGAGLVAVVVAHRRVQAAADLAALAGASAAQAGREPCRAAGAIAGASHVGLTRCAAAGGVVEVVVETTIEVVGSWTLSGHARAGPAGTG